jgi:c-di-AMP phosphodiesterase-like protein
MERLGGGGHISSAGCQFEGVSIDEAISMLKNQLDAMIESGELS